MRTATADDNLVNRKEAECPGDMSTTTKTWKLEESRAKVCFGMQ